MLRPEVLVSDPAGAQSWRCQENGKKKNRRERGSEMTKQLINKKISQSIFALASGALVWAAGVTACSVVTGVDTPTVAVAGNTWPAPVQGDGNTWPAPVDGDGNTWPVAVADGNTWP